MHDEYRPPYTLSDQSVCLIVEIGELVGSISVQGGMNANPRLRRDNRIRTIHASLAIENNSLSIDQVTDIIDGKRILGAPGEIREVKNAYDAYEHLLGYDPFSAADLQKAHATLMADLTNEPGIFRTGGVGVFGGGKLLHMAPPADRVPSLVYDLLRWTGNAEVHPLVKSSVFHYEFEFIHPFSDGNGRMGRMWQTLLFYQWKPFFAWLPVETLIRERQDAYYAALAQSDRAADSGPFVEFMLVAIRDALKEIVGNVQVGAQVSAQVEKLLAVLDRSAYSAKELMEKLNLRHRQSFRKHYLNPALEQGLIEMTLPDKPQSSKQRYRAVRS